MDSAAHGAEVVNRLQTGETFDAIVMDVEMPIMDGRRALAMLETFMPAMAARTVFVTGGARTPELARWLDELPQGRVHLKPVDIVLLVESLSALIRRAPRA